MILNWRIYQSNKIVSDCSFCERIYPRFPETKMSIGSNVGSFSFCCSQFPSNDQIVFMTFPVAAFESLQIQFLSRIPLARYSNLPVAQYSDAIALATRSFIDTRYREGRTVDNLSKKIPVTRDLNVYTHVTCILQPRATYSSRSNQKNLTRAR